MVNPAKVEIVEELTEALDESRDFVITDYKGLTVEETETLRQELYEHGSRFHVVKNRLAKRALNNVYGGTASGDSNGAASETTEAAPDLELDDISGVGPSKVEALEDEAFETVQSVAEASIEDLSEVSGVGEATAEKFKDNAQALLDEAGVADSEDTGEDDESDAGGDGDLLEELDEYFQGTTAIALSGDGYVNVAEVIVDFAEEHEDLQIKAGVLNEDVLDNNQLEAVSELPSRQELLSMLAGVLQKPVQKLAYNLNYPIQQLVQSIDQVKDEKESSS